jgi:hypothetical protein
VEIYSRELDYSMTQAKANINKKKKMPGGGD